MTHLDVRHVVQGRVISSDTAFLDSIQTELPDRDGVTLGSEFAVSRTAVIDVDAEQLTARMTFADDGSEFADVNGVTKRVVDRESTDESTVSRSDVSDADIFGPATAARRLFETVASSDLAANADDWELRLYRSPEGAVTSEQVQQWYESHPSEQPTQTLDDGSTESFVPSAWNPEHHIIEQRP